MKTPTITLLILSMLVCATGHAAADVGFRPESVPLTTVELQTISATGFWGGVLCGAAVAGTAAGTFALITAVGAGTTVTLGAAFAYSSALHVAALCVSLN